MEILATNKNFDKENIVKILYEAKSPSQIFRGYFNPKKK